MGPTPGLYLVKVYGREGEMAELVMSPALYQYFVRRFFKGFFPAVRFTAAFAPVE
jgi:hypothetical protein